MHRRTPAHTGTTGTPARAGTLGWGGWREQFGSSDVLLSSVAMAVPLVWQVLWAPLTGTASEHNLLELLTHPHVRAGLGDGGTPREPFKHNLMGVNSISAAHVHVRPMGRTCR